MKKSKSKSKHNKTTQARNPSSARDYHSRLDPYSALRKFQEIYHLPDAFRDVFEPFKPTIIQDRRRFDPNLFKYLTRWGTAALLKPRSRPVKNDRYRMSDHVAYAFKDPTNAMVCIRRRKRREGVFLQASRGRGGSSVLKKWGRLQKHYNEDSDIHCERRR